MTVFQNSLVRMEITCLLPYFKNSNASSYVSALRTSIFFLCFLKSLHKSTSRFLKTLASARSATLLASLIIQSFQNLAARYQLPRMSPDAIVALAVCGVFLLALIILIPVVCVLVFYGKITPWIILLVVGADILITVASLGLLTPGASFSISL